MRAGLNTNYGKRLRRLSRRLAKLLRDVPALNDELDFAVGAVYAFMRARELGYQDRKFTLPSEYWDAPLRRAENMGLGKLRRKGKWAAGFYFNSALMRIDAGYDRILKVVTEKKKGKTPARVREINKMLKTPFRNDNLKKVNREVISLKHDPTGIADGRKVIFEEAMFALEELISLVETKEIREKLI